MLVSDLRKLSPNQCLEEKEKNQDIFTFVIFCLLRLLTRISSITALATTASEE